jgi:hypothetical protein
MRDIEISKALALAIGYLPEHVRVYGVGSITYHKGEGVVQVFRHDGVYGVHRTECNHLWNNFQYEKWAIAGPIAERYDCFPYKSYYGKWVTNLGQTDQDTPQKAIALAVIGAKK